MSRPCHAPIKKRQLAPTSAYPIVTRSKRAQLYPILYRDEQGRIYRKGEEKDTFYIEIERGQKELPQPKWPEAGTIVYLKKEEEETKEIAHVDYVGYDNKTKSTYIVLTFMH
jgi:hypothetical protein